MRAPVVMIAILAACAETIVPDEQSNVLGSWLVAYNPSPCRNMNESTGTFTIGRTEGGLYVDCWLCADQGGIPEIAVDVHGHAATVEITNVVPVVGDPDHPVDLVVEIEADGYPSAEVTWRRHFDGCLTAVPATNCPPCAARLLVSRL